MEEGRYLAVRSGARSSTSAVICSWHLRAATRWIFTRLAGAVGVWSIASEYDGALARMSGRSGSAGLERPM